MRKSLLNQTAVAWAGVLAMALGVVVMLGPTAQAGTLRRASTNQGGSSGGADPGTFLTGYFDTTSGSESFGAGDNALRIENPTAANGNLCAMVYIFDASEELGECCGCLLTPNQLLQDSVDTIIGSGWEISGGTPAQGVIQIVSTLPNATTSCNPAAAYTPTANLNGWVTHAQSVGGITGLTEVSLTDNGAADATEAAYLISTCGNILSNGSGKGSCTCPTQP
ncbi:MAG: hypothetical protein ACYDC3_17000 [Candidatus Binataceae bacterium]